MVYYKYKDGGKDLKEIEMIVGRNEIKDSNEWNVYLNHLERNARFEKDAVEVQKNELSIYREVLIKDILNTSSQFDEEYLKGASVRTLERIQDGLM